MVTVSADYCSGSDWRFVYAVCSKELVETAEGLMEFIFTYLLPIWYIINIERYLRNGDVMSNKERVLQLIDNIPDYKLTYVVDMLNSIKSLLVEEIEPDEWDLQMIEAAQKSNDGTTVAFEEMLKKDGLTYEDLQD